MTLKNSDDSRSCIGTFVSSSEKKGLYHSISRGCMHVQGGDQKGGCGRLPHRSSAGRRCVCRQQHPGCSSSSSKLHHVWRLPAADPCNCVRCNPGQLHHRSGASDHFGSHQQQCACQFFQPAVRWDTHPLSCCSVLLFQFQYSAIGMLRFNFTRLTLHSAVQQGPLLKHEKEDGSYAPLT